MRELINIVEDPQLKKEIINVVKSTDDLTVLQRVLNTLKAGNIDDRIKTVIGQDGDAQQFLKKIISAIMSIEAPVEEKNAFLDKYAKGSVINTSLLLDGKLHSFAELVGTGFALDLFKQLSVELVSQGVGPGEVALAVLSPDIQWSGRAGGGGDIQVKKKPVEVKTRVSKGGRWINARKAKLDLGAVATSIAKAIASNSITPKPRNIPDRINPTYWVESIRPGIPSASLKKLAKVVADSTFKFADNSSYQTALVAGDASAIVNAFLDVGYNNYKTYSGFVGMLLMDIPTDQLQYFTDYKDMSGSISVSTTYIYAPESEMMPQVILSPGAGPIRAGKFKSDTTAIATAAQKGKSSEIKKRVDDYAKKITDHYGVTDPRIVAQVSGVILTDLQHGVDPAKIPARLAKVFPELGARKKSQVDTAQDPNSSQQDRPTQQPNEPERQRR